MNLRKTAPKRRNNYFYAPALAPEFFSVIASLDNLWYNKNSGEKGSAAVHPV